MTISEVLHEDGVDSEVYELVNKDDAQQNEKSDKSRVDVTVPDGGWGWMVVLGSTLSHCLLPGLGRTFGVIYLVLLERFQESAGKTSLVLAIFNTCRQLFGTVAGMLAERFSCRACVITGGVIMLLGCVISAFATSLFYLYISFGIITGLGGGLIFAPSYIIVAQYFDKKKGRAMSFATIGSGLGMIALAPILDLLLHHYSLYGCFLILGAIQFNNCVSGCLFRPLPKHRKVQEEVKPVKTSSCAPDGRLALLRNSAFLV